METVGYSPNYKPGWGDPVFTVRLPAPLKTALKKLASDEGRTTSDILRSLVEEELKRKGYRLTDEPIEGQMMIE